MRSNIKTNKILSYVLDLQFCQFIVAFVVALVDEFSTFV